MKLEGYSNYEIDIENGTIFSYKRNKFLRGYTNEFGYRMLELCDDNGVSQKWRLHRLIWTVVNGEIPDGMEINHNDENKNNNSINNLSLMTHKENCNWGTRTERSSKTRSKPIVALQDGELKMYFSSAQESETKGFKQSNICNCCNGIIKTAYGYQWQHLDTFLSEWWDNEYMS